MNYQDMHEVITVVREKWYERFPIRIDRGDLQAATDKLMQQDQEWIGSEEIVSDDMRVAFQEWLEQRIGDILDDPVEETNRRWSGFDDVLSRVQSKHRIQIKGNVDVVSTGAQYEDANKEYSRVWDGNTSFVGSDAEQQAWERMVAARGAYLDAIERALIGKESDDATGGKDDQK